MEIGSGGVRAREAIEVKHVNTSKQAHSTQATPQHTRGLRALARRVRARAAKRLSRRGIVSVLSMMFLVMFGSLAIAMAVASQGNLRTASTHLHMIKAMSAAETGMALAQGKLQEAAARFVIDKGTVAGSFGTRLWAGQLTSSDGRINILPAKNGRFDATTTNGIADAVLNALLTDSNILTPNGFPNAATKFNASGVDTAVFTANAWVRSPLIAIDGSASQSGTYPAAYQVTYAPLANGTDVRIIVTGYSAMSNSGAGFQYGSVASDATARSVTRVIQQDFRIVKRPAHAMLSPSRIMIGKNVMVTGNLGARYTDVTRTNGDPIQSKSDFEGLDATLDAKLARFYQALKQYDVDGDNRLRVGHPIESQGLPGAAELTSKNWPSNAFSDVTRDGFVDDFDIFINHYDTNRDGDVVLSARLTAGTPSAGRAAEFSSDDDLALLIDSNNPDRNRNGISGFADTNDNNRLTPTSALLDPNDRVLGYRDGVINYKDQYAKVRGKLIFKTSKGAWQSARGGSYVDQLEGPIVAGAGNSATQFSATDDDLPAIDASSFSNAQTPLTAAANGGSFDTQVAQQLGISTGQLASYTELGSSATAPQYWRSDLDPAYVFTKTGRQIYEKMPFNSPTFTDWYYRPRYVNMTFKNVQIPQGNNGLFINCKFIGVTYVRSYADNTHVNWSSYGAMEWSSASNRPVLKTTPLDKSDFARYTTNNIIDGPSNYASFPDPPIINGSVKLGATRNTKLYSNNIRFHDALFVGSIVSDTPSSYTNIRNKLQFTGATRFTTVNPDAPTNANLNPDASALPEIQKSSLLAPNYSVDVGSFNAPTDTFTGGPTSQNVQLNGTIVAGVLDVRGNANIDGALFLTFAPVAGQGPLQSFGQPVGNPANFNSTLGYFGPTDGDGEALDPATLPTVGGRKIVGYDTDGDGLPDVNPDQPQPAGSTAIPFYGFGRIRLNWNPNRPMPDGILLPVSVVPVSLSYREGKQ